MFRRKHEKLKNANVQTYWLVLVKIVRSLKVLLHRRVKAKKQRFFIGHRASFQSMDHVALGVIPKYRPGSGYFNPALDNTDELVRTSIASKCMMNYNVK